MSRLRDALRRLGPGRDCTSCVEEISRMRRERDTAEERALSAERRLGAARMHGDAARLVAEGHAAQLERVWQLVPRWDSQPGRDEAAEELRQALHGPATTDGGAQ